MNRLFKEEPSSHTFDDLLKDGRTRWSGVKDPPVSVMPVGEREWTVVARLARLRE